MAEIRDHPTTEEVQTKMSLLLRRYLEIFLAVEETFSEVSLVNNYSYQVNKRSYKINLDIVYFQPVRNNVRKNKKILT